jgi:hypothetical protein
MLECTKEAFNNMGCAGANGTHAANQVVARPKPLAFVVGNLTA